MQGTWNQNLKTNHLAQEHKAHLHMKHTHMHTSNVSWFLITIIIDARDTVSTLHRWFTKHPLNPLDVWTSAKFDLVVFELERNRELATNPDQVNV